MFRLIGAVIDKLFGIVFAISKYLLIGIGITTLVILVLT